MHTKSPRKRRVSWVSAARVLPADPVRALGAVLALPDRDAMFDLVDELSARGERFGAMRCARRADDREIADAQRAHAVGCGDANAVHRGFDLFADALHLGER